MLLVAVDVLFDVLCVVRFVVFLKTGHRLVVRNSLKISSGSEDGPVNTVLDMNEDERYEGESEGDDDPSRCLWNAAREGDAESVTYFLDLGADPSFAGTSPFSSCNP